jgi:hypothetical protein
MSKFTIEVNDEVSVAPLAKMLVTHGYRLRGVPHQSAVELTESPERRAAIVREAHATAKLKAEIAGYTPEELRALEQGEAARHLLLEQGREP